MEISVFISTMHMEDDRLIRAMRLSGEGISVINQCDTDGVREIRADGCTLTVHDFAEKGLARSRNRALSLSKDDLIWMIDDDLCLRDDWRESIQTAFSERPQADAIVFNVTSTTPDRPQRSIDGETTIRIGNALRYPTYRMVFRADSLRLASLRFREEFGSGSIYRSGEDSLFTVDCLRAGMQIVGLPIEIATVEHRDSGWFQGFDEKFRFDKGAIFRAMFGGRSVLYCAAMLLRHKDWQGGIGLGKALFQMLAGGRDYARRSRSRRAKSV